MEENIQAGLKRTGETHPALKSSDTAHVKRIVSRMPSYPMLLPDELNGFFLKKTPNT